MRNTWLLYLTSTQAKWSYFELSWVELGLRLGFDNIRAPWVCVAKQLFSESLVEGGGGGHRPPLTRTCVTFSQLRLDTEECNPTPWLLCRPVFRPDVVKKERGKSLLVFNMILICPLQCGQ